MTAIGLPLQRAPYDPDSTAFALSDEGRAWLLNGGGDDAP
jgi:hypothetical protein